MIFKKWLVLSLPVLLLTKEVNALQSKQVEDAVLAHISLYYKEPLNKKTADQIIKTISPEIIKNSSLYQSLDQRKTFKEFLIHVYCGFPQVLSGKLDLINIYRQVLVDLAQQNESLLNDPQRQDKELLMVFALYNTNLGFFFSCYNKIYSKYPENFKQSVQRAYDFLQTMKKEEDPDNNDPFLLMLIHQVELIYKNYVLKGN